MAGKKGDTSDKLVAMRQVLLPEMLSRARDRRSYSEMARRCGLSVATIQRLETGANDVPSRRTLEALAEGYHIDIEDLAAAVYGLHYERTDPLVKATA